MVMFKESSKHSKLSTKLSTIWQINDYLSKKIDNRLIVDIIDTRGHPANVPPLNNESESNVPPETWKTSIHPFFLVMVHINTVCA